MLALLGGVKKDRERRYQQFVENGLAMDDAASLLGVQTGVAISCQLKKLAQLLEVDRALRLNVEQIEKRLDGKQRHYSKG